MHTHTWLSDATLEGGFNLMCLMLTLVARNTHTHPLFQPACHFISWDLIYSFHLFHFFYYYMCSHLKRSRCDANPRVSDSQFADGGSIMPFSAFRWNGKHTPYSHKLNCATWCQTTDSYLAGCFNWLQLEAVSQHSGCIQPLCGCVNFPITAYENTKWLNMLFLSFKSIVYFVQCIEMHHQVAGAVFLLVVHIEHLISKDKRSTTKI